MDKKRLPVLRTDMSELRKMYVALDENLAKRVALGREQGHSIPCTRGCSNCCFDVAIVNQFDMVPIVFRLRKMGRDQLQLIRAQLEEWFVKMRAGGIDPMSVTPDLQQWHRVHAACPLLDQEKRECMVYEERPLVCRGHIVINQAASDCGNRANVPVITTMVNEELLAQALAYSINIHCANAATGQIMLMSYVLPTMLHRAWSMVKNPKRSIVKWLSDIARMQPTGEEYGTENAERSDGDHEEEVDARGAGDAWIQGDPAADASG